MSNKKLSRRAEKPRLSRWRQKEKAKTLGGRPPQGTFCHLVVMPDVGFQQNFLSFSRLCLSGIRDSLHFLDFRSSVIFFLESSPIYRLLVAI